MQRLIWLQAGRVTSDTGCDTYSSRRWAVPLSAAISITHDPPCLPTGRLYLLRENREREQGQLERVQHLILTINPAKHEKTFWWRGRQSSHTSEAANVATETILETDSVWLRRHYYTPFSEKLYSLVERVGSDGAFAYHATAQNPGETIKIENGFHSWI